MRGFAKKAETPAGAGASPFWLVCRRLLGPIDNEDRQWNCLWFQFQAKLLFNGGEESGVMRTDWFTGIVVSFAPDCSLVCAAPSGENFSVKS